MLILRWEIDSVNIEMENRVLTSEMESINIEMENRETEC